MQASDKTSLWQQLMINQALELDSPMTECANQTAQLLSWCCPRIQGSKQCCWTHTSVWLTPKAYTKLRAQNLRQHMLLVPAGGASLCMYSGYFISLTWVLTLLFLGKCAQSYLTPCDPMDCSPPASSVHGILQARILEWVAISSSKGSSRSREWTSVFYISCTGRQALYH